MHKTREEWLAAAAVELTALFEEHGRAVPKLRVACGFPSSRALAQKNRSIGECWYDNSSKDKTFEIFVSPVLDAPLRVLDVLAHEMCHAVLPPKTGHKGPFKKLAQAIGLDGKPTATVAGDQFKTWAAPVLERLNGYPHAELKPVVERKKQTTRLRKCECPTCGYVARVTAKWIDEVGPPHCPAHGAMETDDGEGEDE